MTKHIKQQLTQWETKGFTIQTAHYAEQDKTVGTVTFEGHIIYSYSSDKYFKSIQANDKKEQEEMVLCVVLGKLQASKVFEYTLVNGDNKYILEENVLEAVNMLVYGHCVHPNEITQIQFKPLI